MKTHKLYVYGTLMTGNTERVQVPGRLYDLGWYPGAKISTPECGTSFLAEIREITDAQLKSFDRYEGYYENSPAASLYIRKPYLDGWIYEYNRTPSEDRFIESGDWLAHSVPSRKDEDPRFLKEEEAV